MKEIIFIVSFKHIILYGKFYFYFQIDNWIINCESSYTVTSNVQTKTIGTPTYMIMKVKSANIKYGGKTIKYINE
jgi:hypothetical protein